MTSVAAQHALGYRRLLMQSALFGAAAVLLVALVVASGSERLGWDFRYSYLPAAESVIHGDSPYPDSPTQAVTERRGYIYPPQLAFALAPFTVVPAGVASALAALAALAALLGALWIVGVRDALCFAALVLWAPAWNELEMANVTALLALGLALVWRHRTTTWPLATVLGLVVSTKLFLFPFVVWAAAIRRVRQALLAVAIGVAVTFLSWAAIGFAGLTRYPDLLRIFDEIQAETSYSFVGIGSLLAADDSVLRVSMLVVGGGLLVGCWLSGRNNDPFRAFTLALAACLVLAPIVWQHTLVLLAVPLGIARPRFSPLWLVPIFLWVSPRAGNGDGIETVLPALVVTLLVAALVFEPHAEAAGRAEAAA